MKTYYSNVRFELYLDTGRDYLHDEAIAKIDVTKDYLSDEEIEEIVKDFKNRYTVLQIGVAWSEIENWKEGEDYIEFEDENGDIQVKFLSQELKNIMDILIGEKEIYEALDRLEKKREKEYLEEE